jgi:hypothetical protein
VRGLRKAPFLEGTSMSLFACRALSLAMISVGVCAVGACAVSRGTDSEGATSALDTTPGCDLSGTWAMRLQTAVKWPATFVLQGGTGTLTTWVRSTRVQNGTQTMDTAHLCGVDVPDYQATAQFGSERYGVRFPDTLFDGASMPTFTFGATLSTTDVGATFTTAPIAALIGATMTNPATDTWPSNGAALTQVDADGDGKPGVSGDAAQGTGFFNPPVNAVRSARANRVYTVFRNVLSAKGTLSSCTRAEGTGTTAVINNKAAIDSHVLGCRRADNGNDCASSEFKLLDSAAPVYTPSGDMKITMIKVDDATTCANIRTMAFDPVVTDGGVSVDAAVATPADPSVSAQ